MNFLLLIYSHCWTEILADNTILVFSGFDNVLPDVFVKLKWDAWWISVVLYHARALLQNSAAYWNHNDELAISISIVSAELIKEERKEGKGCKLMLRLEKGKYS